MRSVVGFAILLVSAAVLARTPRSDGVIESDDIRYQKINAFGVIGINFEQQKAAIRMVHEKSVVDPMSGEIIEPLSCGYAGMQDHPKAGVTLAIWDIASGKELESFTIYKSVVKKNECTPRAQSEKMLREAKEAIRRIGVDPQARLEGTRAVFDQAGMLTVPLKSGDIRFGLVKNSYSSETPDLPQWCAGSMPDHKCLELKLVEKIKGTQLLFKRYIYPLYMHMTGGMEIETYFSNGEQVVFLGKIWFLCTMSGCDSTIMEDRFFSKVVQNTGDRRNTGDRH